METRSKTNLRAVITLLLTISVVTLTMLNWNGEMQRRDLKADLAQLSEIQYGLFNVDEWKSILIRVVSTNIDEFHLDTEDREKLKEKVSKFLHETVDDFEARYHETERGRKGNVIEQITGDLRSAVVSSTKLFDHVREDIPQFTNDIVEFINDPENADMVKDVLQEKLDEFAAETFAEMDYSVRDGICQKYACENKTATISYLNNALDNLERRQHPLNIAWAIVVFVALLFALLVSPHGKLEYMAMFAMAFVLLIAGVSLPMIDIDARISSLSFHLLGEHIEFENQVVYRKSKSILQVVQLMLTNGQLQTKFVGFLVLLFSILLPFTKLVCSLFYLFREKSRKNRFVQIIVFKSGKWSMADVMVVAIFMSFIGFSSIVTEQMRQLEGFAPSLDMLTTNNSELLFGFYAFVGFVLMSMFISRHLEDVSSLEERT